MRIMGRSHMLTLETIPGVDVAKDKPEKRRTQARTNLLTAGTSKKKNQAP
jgi:hypothetical protein